MVTVGVATLLLAYDGGLWFLRRRGAHGAGTYAPCGGRVEHAEPLLDAARRELAEEAGLAPLLLAPLTIAPMTRDTFREEGLDYLTFWFVADIGTQEPHLMEPTKNDGWIKVRPGEPLPAPRFLCLENLLEAIAQRAERSRPGLNLWNLFHVASYAVEHAEGPSAPR